MRDDSEISINGKVVASGWVATVLFIAVLLLIFFTGVAVGSLL